MGLFDKKQESSPSPSPEDLVMRFLKWDHLPEDLQVVSRPFYDLAYVMCHTLPHDPELTTCLRKIREAKDCAVGLAAWVHDQYGAPDNG